jgi:uncharacterized protein YaaW (UPF0174 family)
MQDQGISRDVSAVVTCWETLARQMATEASETFRKSMTAVESTLLVVEQSWSVKSEATTKLINTNNTQVGWAKASVAVVASWNYGHTLPALLTVAPPGSSCTRCSMGHVS